MMVNLKINGKKIAVPAGTKLIAAAEKAGAEIPTMCYKKGYPHFTSCMICTVQEMKSGRMLPACSLPVAEGLEIETENQTVTDMRWETLELLMSDHVGDCIAPCRRTCPAHMNIPLMNMYIESGKAREALMTVKEHIALPAVLGRICPAPCEVNCRRSFVDRRLSICALKCYVADEDLASEKPYLPACKTPCGKKVAIIGSGPAGLAAAYYLQQMGYTCTVFDKNPQPGGMLRYGVEKSILPREVLDAEIEIIRRLGAEFVMQKSLGSDFTIKDLQQGFDAIALAAGLLSAEELPALGVAAKGRSVKVDNFTFQTDIAGVFAGGGIINPGKMAVRSVGHGKSMADSIDRYLSGRVQMMRLNRALSKVGKIKENELDAYAAGIGALKIDVYDHEFHRLLLEKNNAGISRVQAEGEAGQCLQCGCISFDNCKLRLYSEQYGANSQRFKGEDRRSIERVFDHPHVLYEPGKCIQCGLCVRITEKEGETLGLSFIGRGFNVKIGAALNGSMADTLKKTADLCVEACPSGALAFKENLCRFR